MRFFLISDNIDTRLGMRLAGIEGIVVHEKEEVISELKTAMSDKDIAIILITEKLAELCQKEVYNYKQNNPSPLILIVPDRHGAGRNEDAIANYVKEAIGINIR